MKIDLIAFNGGYGVGKSEAINSIREAAGEREVHLVKFAQPLYDIQEFIYSRIGKSYRRPDDFVKDRKLLQWLGTDWGRSLDTNLWVNEWKAEYLAAVSRGALVVCDDCRFDNEAEIVTELGGKIIRITRPDNDKHAAGGTGIANHASEQGIDPKYLTATIKNDGSLADYKTSLKGLAERLGFVNG